MLIQAYIFHHFLGVGGLDYERDYTEDESLTNYFIQLKGYLA